MEGNVGNTNFNPESVVKQPVNFRQINLHLKNAHKLIKNSKKILSTDAEIAFNAAYEGMLKASLALMLSDGYRPRISVGHHKTLVEYAKVTLGQKFRHLTNTYNRIRIKRNKVTYDAKTVSDTEAKSAVALANKYFEAVEKHIASKNPQQKLWKP